MKLLVLAVVMLVAQANAFWIFGRNEETTATADGRPVNASCVQQGQLGTCEFFRCFEHRLMCGRDFYMQRYGIHYCMRFQRNKAAFTDEGQTFLEASQRCITQSLVEHYQREYVNCHRLEHDAIALVRPCYTQHGFCDIIRDNTRAFLQVFQIRDLFRSGAGKLWREIAGLARDCGGRALSNFWRATATNFF